MPPKRNGKLVRDRIPAIIEAEGKRPRTRTLGLKGYQRALRTKLIEEAGECAQARGVAELTEELADLYEVAAALTRAYSITPQAIRAAMRYKRTNRGGFENRTFLIDIKD